MKIQPIQYNNNVTFRGFFSRKNNTNPVILSEQQSDSFEREASAQEVPTWKNVFSKIKNPITTITEKISENNKVKEHEYNRELLENWFMNTTKIRDRVVDGKLDLAKYPEHTLSEFSPLNEYNDIMDCFIKQQLTEDYERKLPTHKCSFKELVGTMGYVTRYPEAYGEVFLAKDINGEIPFHRFLTSDYTKEALKNIRDFEYYPYFRDNDKLRKQILVTAFEAKNPDGMSLLDWLLNYNVLNKGIDIVYPYESDGVIAAISRYKKDYIRENGKFEPYIPLKDLKRKEIMDTLCNQNTPELEGILNVLNYPNIKSTSGLDLNLNEHFTADMVEFLTNFATPDERAQIIPKLYQMKNLDYDKVTTNGIPALELIFNAEDETLLDIVKNKHFIYRPELDYAFNNIQNEKVKTLAKNIKIDIKDLETAIWFSSKEMLEMAKHQFESPLYKKEYNGVKLGRYGWYRGSLLGCASDYGKYIPWHSLKTYISKSISLKI